MTTPLRRRLLVFGVTALVTAGGCSFLRAEPERTKFYTLAATPPSAASPASPMPALVLGVGPVSLPPYLDRDQIVRRVDATRVELLDYERWAEPLEASTQRVLAVNLSRALGTEQVLMYPWPLNRPVDWAVAVTVAHFEPVASGGAQLVARWSVRAGSTERPTVTRDSVLTVPASTATIDASVAAMNQALGTLAEEIAAAVRQVQSAVEPPAVPTRRR
jgi:uncharacterized protein